MAKKIYMTDADVENIVGELRSTLSGMKCYGAIDIKRTFKTDDRFALIYFTPSAWAKMVTLVARYNTEVQWHGCVRRVSEFEFEIYDILVPPHEVTGTTVTSDYKPYGEWLNGLDDETFNSVKFHGHSHVDMSVSPSGTDEKYRLDLVTQLPKPVNGMDVFYIFLIINKRHEWSAEIYDFTHNALYSTADIAIDTIFDEDGNGLENFMAEAKKVAVSRTYTGTYYGNHGSSYGGSSYGGSYKGGTYEQPKTVTPVSQVGNSKAASPSAAKKKGKGKGKKNGGGKCCGYDTWEEYYAAVYGVDEDDVELTDTDDEGVVATTSEIDDDENDPTSPFYVREWGCT
ncbi:MAG: hypothetical protein IJX55_10865 [Clostridia bacterium]|nr:hypothetical protein [Clostridia bacterium]